jgi:hypothetical protein
MKKSRKVLLGGGAAMTVVATALAAVVGAQAAPQPQSEAIDFTAAVMAEVRNAQGQVLLTGKFAVVEEDDDDIERKAALTPTGIVAGATGEAEVEVDRAGNPRRQEVEFSVANVPAGTVLTFVIDGKVFATVTADSRGRAAHEREVPLPVKPSR